MRARGDPAGASRPAFASRPRASPGSCWQVIDVGYGGGRGKAPEKLERRLSFSRRKAGRELQQHIESKLEQAGENREAALAAKVEKARLRGSSAANSARSSAVERASDAETVADDNDCGFGARLTGRRSDGDSS